MRRPRFTKDFRKIMYPEEFFSYAKNIPIKPAHTKNFKNGDRLMIGNEIHYYLQALDLFFTKEDIEKYFEEGNENDNRWILGYFEQ